MCFLIRKPYHCGRMVLLLLQDPLDYKYYKSCVHFNKVYYCHNIGSSTYLPFNWNIVVVNLVNQNRKN